MALASLAALTACGHNPSNQADSGEEHQVASLPGAPSAGAGDKGAKAPGTPNESGRPQLRLDDSPERRQRLVAAWDRCLLAHGAKTGGPGAAAPPGNNEEQPVSIAEPIPENAKRACANKLPILPPELDSVRNPNYRRDMQEEVQCLRSKGIKVHLVNDTSLSPNGLSWTYDDDYVASGQDTSKIEHDCEMEAFSDKK
ncbi:hypothetical protein [Streptomyces sp. NPDC001635]|nr:hypothetical protein E4K10_46515 [Streptomyces sp. T1317-0309]